MHQQLVVVLLVGLAVSAYGLDISHTAVRSTELEAHEKGLLSDIYSQVVYPPLNHIVTSLALMGAQLLAGIHANGLPAPNGRILHPSDAELRGFFDDIWNSVMKPPLENALSGLSLMAAQLLAGVGTEGINLGNLFGGLGKRDLTEAEMRNARDFLSDLFANIFQKPLENALQGGALMLAQLLAGIGTEGVNLSGIGKRDLTEAEMRTARDFLSELFANIFQKPLENALQGGALMLAQVLAGVGTEGINLNNLFGGVGKRDLNDIAARQAELRGFFDSLGQSLLNGLNSVWTNILQKPLENALQTGALMGAQVLAGMGTEGVNLGSLFGGIGKRDLSAEQRGIFEDLLQSIVMPLVGNALNGVMSQLNNLLSSAAGRR